MEKRVDFDPIAEVNKHYDDIDALCERWENCSIELGDFEFDIEEFRALAKETYDWIVKFFMADLFPAKIVELLLRVRDFASHKEYVSEESDAAVLVADTLCDVGNYFGILGRNPMNYEISPENQQFEVGGPTKFITINTETFDLTELIDDIKNS